MSLLDDARRIEQVGPYLVEGSHCVMCHEQVAAFGVNPVFPAKPHKPDCHWLSMPKIVAALEAAEDAVTAWENTRDGAPDYSVMSALRLAMRR